MTFLLDRSLGEPRMSELAVMIGVLAVAFGPILALRLAGLFGHAWFLTDLRFDFFVGPPRMTALFKVHGVHPKAGLPVLALDGRCLLCCRGLCLEALDICTLFVGILGEQALL